ncbi:MAG: C25 family cysteine peptidase [Candidatus Krumholzibacteriota bacterium]
MCLFTHFAAGALAGGVTGNVYLGAAAGLASHAVLDVVPHYDHPDWRLELGGGLASLVILLLMPFSSWPAVVGGVFGMIPDLENLFQKLGRMGRDRFLFPTHTGLLPHGRELGPKTLVWQVAIFVGCFVVLSVVSPAAAMAAEPVGQSAEMGTPRVRLLSSSSEQSVVRIDFPVLKSPADWQSLADEDLKWALPRRVEDEFSENPRLLPPGLSLSLAVPTRQPVFARVFDVTWWREPREALVEGDLVTMGDPAVHRSVPLVGGMVSLGVKGGVLAGITVEISHPSSAAQRRQLNLARDFEASGQEDRWNEVVPAGLLNAELFRALARGGRQAALARRNVAKAQAFDPFALTAHWVKLDVSRSGLYRLTGQQLLIYGVTTSDIDPDKLRLYRGGGLALAADAGLPDSLQSERVELNEVAIEVRDGGDGEWNLDDEIRFYGVPTSAWTDRLDPEAGRDAHYDHPFAGHATYWLTWEAAATPSPLPGAPRRVPAVEAVPTGGEAVPDALLRLHQERQVRDTAGYFEDNWAWDNTITSSRPESFTLRTPVPGSSARFVIDLAGVYPRTTWSYVFEAAGWLNDDQANQGTVTFNRSAQNDSLRLRIIGDSQSVTAGLNRITLKNINNNAGATTLALALDSYDIFYWAGLDLTDRPGQLEFAHWGEHVAVPGTAVDLQLTAPAGVTPLMWEVSDPAAATAYTGTADTEAPAIFTYGFVREPETDRHFVAAVPGDLLNVDSGRRTNPVSLRSNPVDWDYIVVHAGQFEDPARDLADFHSTNLPGVASPRATHVSANDIYDNFSGGQKDVHAIRNYLKHVFEQGGHRLRFVCFLGNTSRDFRHYRDPDPAFELFDFLPTVLRTNYPVIPSSYGDMAYATDDGLVSFESGTWVSPDLPDLACGRLPASSLGEARDLVDRAIRYSRSPEEGLWRNRVLFTADDCVKFSTWPDPVLGEDQHTVQAEVLSNNLLPVSLDVQKVYGVAYDFPPSSRVKPAMRGDINNELSRGATIYYYVGHGAEDNLADEQIFQSSDITNLTNGMKRPVFIAFSCDVGVFDSTSRLSMAEQFVLAGNGGGIGAICASQVSFITPNEHLSNAFFSNLYPDRHVLATVTPAEALMLAKNTYVISRSNSQRYNFFGDPGLRLPNPEDDLVYAAASLDTLKAGALQSVVVGAAGSKFLYGPGDNYDLLAQDARFDQGYINSLRDSSIAGGGSVKVPRWNTYVAAGSPVFIGTGVAGAGDLKVDFKVPTKIRYGEDARLRTLVGSPDDMHAAVQYVPAVVSATGPSDDVTGPEIGLAFEDNRFKVSPGTLLNATLADTSGISILGTTPGNSLLMEFDKSGFMTDVTGSFAYDANSYVQGRVSIPLPGDLKMGLHLVSLYASDALGNVGTDTLSFEVVPALVPEIDRITLFPNPTAGPCRLIFELSDPMEVQWEIYTLAGNRLKTLRRQFSQAGPRILEWDGRDNHGDEIANGTYLFVLRGLGGGSQGRDITRTGKLVIMR